MKKPFSGSKKKKNSGLVLTVSISNANNLVPSPTGQQSLIKCNPKCYIKLPPDTLQKTNKVKSSTSPVFNSTVKLPLKNPRTHSSKKKSKSPADSYLILTISIWDKKGTKKSYLGELRLSVLDLLKELSQSPQNEIPYSSYKLFSSVSEKRFVTGSINAKFTLSGFERDLKRSSNTYASSASLSSATPSTGLVPTAKSSSQTNLPPLITIEHHTSSTTTDNSNPDEDDEYDEEEDEGNLVPVSSNISEAVAVYITKLEEYLESQKSAGNNPLSLLTLDEQGFYTNEQDSFDPLADELDCISLNSEDEDDEDEKNPHLALPPKQSQLNQMGDTYSSLDEGGTTSAFSSQLSLPEQLLTQSTEVSEQKKRFQKLRRNKNKGLSSNNVSAYESSVDNIASMSAPGSAGTDGSISSGLDKCKYLFQNRSDVAGVLFLEIISASELPPFKNSTRTGFDMDPFVVISFGTKVFRTSWRKHTLNPIFNERLILEVLEHQTGFDLTFSILDRDILTDNDRVCDKVINISDLISRDSLNDNPDFKVLSSLEEQDPIYKRKIFGKSPRRLVSNNDYTQELKTIEIKMDLIEDQIKKKNKSKLDKEPKLKIRAKFEPYSLLRRKLFSQLLIAFQNDPSSQDMDVTELPDFLQSIGSNFTDEEVSNFWEKRGRNGWVGDKLSFDEIVDEFEAFYDNPENTKPDSQKHIIQLRSCPSCGSKGEGKNESDIIHHLAICCSKDWSSVTKIIEPTYTTSDSATRQWYSKAFVKLAYGKVELGSNNANILVQDRETGIMLEEKMSVYVRLGIKLLYRSFKTNRNSERVKSILKSQSFKQGAKFDDPASASRIESFVKFYSLDLDECLFNDISQYGSFNEFFYRKLKPGARPVDALNDDKVITSAADCRLSVFPSVEESKKLWIKGTTFTVDKLLGPKFDSRKFIDGSIIIFRLAPQDYHRFHSAVDGTIKRIHKIEGEYYTVNPMAIRSSLDVYGENVRVIIEIATENLGTVMMVCVGAMMVGSTVLTANEGDHIKKGDEVGYFKFGGSTVLLLFESGRIVFDNDVLENSTKKGVETLVRVGMSIGHTPDRTQFKRARKYSLDIDDEEEKNRIIRSVTRTVTGSYPGEDTEDEKKYPSWEVQNLDIDDAFKFEIEEQKYDPN
ncbi:unnamed protein product [Ambrosiozyma monospora]|uniref:Phosphatidylserine decarboxylase proenzyme 2 n=1 Tax=Ambrosiozyma monospora TaxID=43982 RepID=A0A9W7DGX3_AMBMO|nr:unnamed protein product [Ambrosiozyma monospora]